MSGSEVKLDKPRSVFRKKITFDIRSMLKALGKGVAHAATLKVEDLGDDFIDLASSLGVESQPQEIAYELVRISLAESLAKLTSESSSHIGVDASDVVLMDKVIDAEVQDVSLVFGKSFLANPAAHPFVKEICGVYLSWLERMGASNSVARAISSRLPSYFVFALASEWARGGLKYKVLIELGNTPFAAAEDAERGWRLYFSYLRRRVSEAVFDEPFGLSQIYVPLNAYVVDRIKGKGLEESVGRRLNKKICVDLAGELRSWLSKGDKADALRVISGGPGSGKSSFTKMFCCELAESGVAKPIYIPLHLIDPVKDVMSEVERFVRDEGLLGFNPLETDRREENLLIVFDGLDELASMGKVAAQVARDFVQAVERAIERRNLGPYPIFVLLSGRELIVQENETEFRKPRQVLTILPYKVNSEEYDGDKRILEGDLRNIWWKNYGELIGRKYDGLPPELQEPEIDEITAQPLLNYLVALSYRRGKLDFSESLNLNNVYADLVSAVHERAYESSRTYRPISHIRLNDFVRVLEEIGLAAWHGSDGRSTSVRDITDHCRQSGLETLLKSFTEGAEAGVTKLLAAFFFRRNGESVGEDASFVFTHKSFGEYLTATRIMRALERLVVERKRRLENADDGYDVPDALLFWLKLTGAAEMTEYLQTFLSREISQREDGFVEELHAVLCELLEYAIEKNMPVEMLGVLNFAKAQRYNSNSSVALFIALNCCARKLNKTVVVKFSAQNTFGTFLRRVCPQRTGPQSPLLYSALSHFDFSGQCLDMGDLYGADLSYTIWRSSTVHYANFGQANLTGATFLKSTVTWSRMEDCKLLDVEFIDCNVSSVIFSGNSLTDVSFERSNLEYTDFSGSRISGCNFNYSSMTRVDLKRVGILIESSFEGVSVDSKDRGFINWFNRMKESRALTGELEILKG